MKELCLGTAMWGWSIDKGTAFSILDCFYAGGGRHVDTANNYPLNGKIHDYRASPIFLAEWCRSRGVKDLKITYKVGTTSNKYSPLIDLSLSNLGDQIMWAKDCFHENLYCIMLHWDNRADLALINDTLQILELLDEEGLNFGLSGIGHPDTYRVALENKKVRQLNIQVKHNFIYSDIEKYKELTCYTPQLWAYGISVSGIKLSVKEYNDNSYVSLVRGAGYHEKVLTDSLREALYKSIDINVGIENIYHIAIAYSEYEKRLQGYLVAPSKLEQMQDILKFINNIDMEQVDLTFLNSLDLNA